MSNENRHGSLRIRKRQEGESETTDTPNTRIVNTEHGFKVELHQEDPDAIAQVVDRALATRKAVVGQIDDSGKLTLKEID